ncbi:MULTISPECIES: TonB-dependent receptor [Paraburkholderia]|uniref:TonB-dependent siderophore receptor n=1 Tax=Paraburkholderia hospita TaxID=169430 RepID=A0AAJ4VV67_9BURK|nr:TonB-dependent siderophore receptor [Paraburkholderia hospita]EUC18928.1 TonB-dependent siderophore receptor [Burkholderia sp. BT03]SKC90859.1 TonB-dependent siderophore receptor [Burkholderia sp. CF099]SOE90863.1 TonB-dependent siderophore receptor [Burkholderia sp. YR290]AUT71574.1 TonB-dependent siderophore receptor [Paraburkholderia hospita]AXF02529.1 TonB-dependent siderophore receptor [Paraburkholderia hospita]
MLRTTPLAAAVMAVFATPLFAQTTTPATPAAQVAQAATSASPASQPSASQPSESNTLPAVKVTGQVDNATDFQSDTSSVGAKVPTALRDIPQAVTVIPKAVLQSQAANSFSDALRNVPGITIGAAEGGQIGNNINLRGFSARTDIYLDGFRDRGQYYRDTFNLDSIDVLYGPSSLYFGRGSTGGVINQVSKEPQLKKRADVSVQAGTHDRYRTTVDLDTPITDTSAFRINAFGQSLGSSRDVMKNKDYGVAPEVKFGIGTPTEITLSALIQHNRDQPDYGVPPLNGHPAPVNRGTFYGYTDDRTIQDVQTFSARIKHRFNEDVTVRNQTQFSHYSTEARATNAASVLTGPLSTSTALANGNFTNIDPSKLFVKLQGKDRNINDHSVYNSTDVEWKFNTGPVKHDLLAGVDLSHETYSNQSFTATSPGMTSNTIGVVPLINPPYTTRPANVKEVATNLAESSANDVGLYLNDTISLGEHWKVVGGVRWDRYEASIKNSINLPGYATQTNYFTSVRGGIIYQPADWQSYYVSYGTSFDPSLEALTLTNGQQNLPPEHNKSYEVGAKLDLLGGGLSVTQSLFSIEKTNARTANPDGSYTLDGDIRVRGYQLGLAGHITSNWQVFGGYTYMDGVILQAFDGTQGKTPANTPRNTLTLWTTYQFTPHWEIGGGPTYMSSRYAANNNFVQVGGYTRWDAMAAYHAKRYDVQINVLNLTDKNYYDALIPSDGGRAVPGYGRTFLATLNYRFF